jgi:sensor histidine kinase YesM
MGFTPERLSQPMSSGIGLTNVRERLHVIYGAAYQLRLDSTPGQGTVATVEVPDAVAPTQASA